MDITLVSAESKEAFFDQLNTFISSRLAAEEAAQVCTFAGLFFENYPLLELEGHTLNDVFGSLYSCWNGLRLAVPGKPSIRVFNPSLEEDGWISSHTAIIICQRDMPFLVDTARIALNNRNIILHGVKSTVVEVARTKTGKFKSLQHPDFSRPGQEGREALIYLEINRHTLDSDLQAIAAAIGAAFADLEIVVADYRPMLSKIIEAAGNLPDAGEAALTGDAAEAKAFLEWLHDGHFTFLGYTEFLFVDTAEGRCLQEQSAARLGLFRTGQKPPRQVLEADFNPGLTRFHVSTQLLSFSKSSKRSRIHRRAYSDYVVVKRFDEQGTVIGEVRFMGLYTSMVYTLSPANIPVMREKMRYILARSGLDPVGHDGKVLRQVIERFPRDELLQASASELHETITAVAQINERHRVRLFMRRDTYGKFVSCIVYVPREDFNTKLREKIQDILAAALGSTEHEFTTYFSESILARTHIVFQVDPTKLAEIDGDRLERKIAAISRSWETHLNQALGEHFGEEQGAKLYADFAEGFSVSYQENFEARFAVHDIAMILSLGEGEAIAMNFYQPPSDDKHLVRFKIMHRHSPVELSDIIPVLEHLGLRVLGEHPYNIRSRRAGVIWLHDFDLHMSVDTELDIHALKDNFQQAFSAIWYGQAESDGFNRLILGAGLNWREVVVLRSYARYMKQTGFNFSLTSIASTLSHHLEITHSLLDLFKATFDPALNQQTEQDQARIETIRQKILSRVELVENLNEDRIIRRYLDMIAGTRRTNFYQADAEGNVKSYISLKLAPREIADIPEPRPLFEIFVYSPRMEGVHLRGGKVARGGLRWSDRHQDYRTEVLGLVKAQQVKNAVIVPNGAKGGFVAKHLPPATDRQAWLAEGIECYRLFVRGLLDLTDNIIEGRIVAPRDVIRIDGDDPYLVVAADKGTATFSDIANAISQEYGHWLGDAFASGGSQGYDHKKMGITARGAWISVQQHFREQGIDVQSQDFTVIGIGDMAGDVFGNGMLQSQHICLTAAFNHLHIFVDPNPDPAATFEERLRLFTTPGVSWADFNKKLISSGGGVFNRAAKSIAISPEMKARFAIEADKLTPNDLISALLQAPVDLIWNGGIGTYVKSARETHADVGDKANDSLRVNGAQLRCKVFGEGGNLGMTQLGRIEFCLNGGACNTDFIDNAAGVDCSDHEVNIKILVDGIVSRGDMTSKQRNQLLVEMTDAVAELVLANNYKQTQVISLAASQSLLRGAEYRRLIGALESSGRLHRGLEFIPDDDALQERYSQNKGLTRPELAVLLSYIKVMLKEELATPKIAQDDYVRRAVATAFPARIQEQYHDQLYQHPLLTEIVATQVANDMVNHMGITFSHRLAESTGCSFVDVAKAYVAARDVFRLHEFFAQVEALDHQVPAALQHDMLLNMSRRMRRACRWFLRNRRGDLTPALEVESFATPVNELLMAMPGVMCAAPRARWESRSASLIEQGVPEQLAHFAALPTALYSGLGIVETAKETGAKPIRVAEIYFCLGDKLGLHWFAEQIAESKVESFWQAMARETFMDDLESQMRLLTAALIRLGGDAPLEQTIERWMAAHSLLIGRWKTMISDLQAAPGTDFAMYSVALRELLDLAQASQHCQTLEDGSVACALT